jgi:hypothetical protein
MKPITEVEAQRALDALVEIVYGPVEDSSSDDSLRESSEHS